MSIEHGQRAAPLDLHVASSDPNVVEIASAELVSSREIREHVVVSTLALALEMRAVGTATLDVVADDGVILYSTAIRVGTCERVEVLIDESWYPSAQLTLERPDVVQVLERSSARYGFECREGGETLANGGVVEVELRSDESLLGASLDIDLTPRMSAPRPEPTHASFLVDGAVIATRPVRVAHESDIAELRLGMKRSRDEGDQWSVAVDVLDAFGDPIDGVFDVSITIDGEHIGSGWFERGEKARNVCARRGELETCQVFYGRWHEAPHACSAGHAAPVSGGLILAASALLAFVRRRGRARPGVTSPRRSSRVSALR